MTEILVKENLVNFEFKNNCLEVRSDDKNGFIEVFILKNTNDNIAEIIKASEEFAESIHSDMPLIFNFKGKKINFFDANDNKVKEFGIELNKFIQSNSKILINNFKGGYFNENK